eukprot:TRINITY_DN56075_c0_g1_i1.p1 TRINITY_DN56075_c0_g1~~TRINITY_DN56075_c0_g1_i1.p1  ORF type:complete len:405 (+),score=135.96 TRINITY_DN56075_c0_g1_i1:68-1216(+)
MDEASSCTRRHVHPGGCGGAHVHADPDTGAAGSAAAREPSECRVVTTPFGWAHREWPQSAQAEAEELLRKAAAAMSARFGPSLTPYMAQGLLKRAAGQVRLCQPPPKLTGLADAFVPSRVDRVSASALLMVYHRGALNMIPETVEFMLGFLCRRPVDELISHLCSRNVDEIAHLIADHAPWKKENADRFAIALIDRARRRPAACCSIARLAAAVSIQEEILQRSEPPAPGAPRSRPPSQLKAAVWEHAYARYQAVVRGSGADSLRRAPLSGAHCVEFISELYTHGVIQASVVHNVIQDLLFEGPFRREDHTGYPECTSDEGAELAMLVLICVGRKLREQEEPAVGTGGVPLLKVYRQTLVRYKPKSNSSYAARRATLEALEI